MKQAFIEKNFQEATLDVIEQANEIIERYQADGYTLTLRQLYYQFVAGDLFPNTQKSYNRLKGIISNARLAGHIDWNAIEDRTRNLEKNLHISSPLDGIRMLREHWYGIDMWTNQEVRVEVWIEKEALMGVIEGVCRELDVPYFACRGNVSQSEQWRAYRRHAAQQRTIILHLGDHDPSGVDMTRDNRDRLDLFHGYNGQTEVERIALNMDQIEEYEPPPNFAKESDSRFEKYREIYGTESWELDALKPSVIDALIRKHVEKYRDPELWAEREADLEDDLLKLDDYVALIEGLDDE